MDTENYDTWMDVQREDHSNEKNPLIGTTPNNYGPITCLPMMENILTPQIRDTDLWLIDKAGNLPRRTERMPKRTKGTEELLYKDQRFLNESKTRRKNLAIAGIDYKKAYDMVPQS